MSEQAPRRAFIVRPFGTKRDVDFDRVEQKLIDPALTQLGIPGRTTGEILRAGDIRDDMFQLLLTADIVIADISIHNANVFYELGIRHALQDRFTVMIKSAVDPTPFDIGPDRYMAYDNEHPEDFVAELVKRVRRTLDGNRSDSPVFRSLPDLRPQSRDRFLRLPLTFTEQVEEARRARHVGDLDAIATELRELALPWASAGLREVGDALFQVEAWDSARETWEYIRRADPLGFEANARLATVYQKQARPNLDRSDAAVQRAIDAPGVSRLQVAELQALEGSNHKTRWIGEWSELDADRRRETALFSRHLDLARRAYLRGFEADLNHYYSGLNALALTAVQVELATALPESWSLEFETEGEAVAALAQRKQDLATLASAVQIAIEVADRKGDAWAEISAADLALLTSRRPERVRRLFRKRLGSASVQQLESCRRQLTMYQRLGVLSANVDAAFEALPEPGGDDARDSADVARVIVFTGHRLDAPGRPTPRFPAASEATARRLIEDAVKAEIEGLEPASVIGISGGASGGDILFHEVCAELGVPTRLFLAAPRKHYVPVSVQDAGGDWVKRFDAIAARCLDATRTLTSNLQLPEWLRAADGFTIWEHNSLWTLSNALAYGPTRVVLLALWDHGPQDGPGGTRHMISRASEGGARTRIIDARPLGDATSASAD